MDTHYMWCSENILENMGLYREGELKYTIYSFKIFYELCKAHFSQILMLKKSILPVFKFSSFFFMTMTVAMAMTAFAGHMEADKDMPVTRDILIWDHGP